MMAALHTEQLEFLLTHLAQRHGSKNRVISLSVFPADCIPSIRDAQQRAYDACFIVNTDPHDQPGKHWLAFYYDSAKRVLEYFDSFGFPLKQHSIVNSNLSGRNLKIVTVNVHGRLQAIDSSTCGYYCVLYLHWRMLFDNSKSSISRLVKLADSTSLRDVAVVKVMHKLMHEHKCSKLPNMFTRFSQSSCSLQ
jgi:hypothetical protein